MCVYVKNDLTGLWYPHCRHETAVKMETYQPPKVGDWCPWCGERVTAYRKASEVRHGKYLFRVR